MSKEFKPLEKNTELEKLNQTFASLKAEFDTVKAEMMPQKEGEDPKYQELCSRMDRCMSSMYAMVDNCHSRISAMDNYHYNAMNDHRKGHLPNLSPSQLSAMLKTCGADGDYEVQKKTIYASRHEVMAEYKK